MDDVDKASQGHKRKCPYCPAVFEDFYVEMAILLLQNHTNRHHKGA